MSDTQATPVNVTELKIRTADDKTPAAPEDFFLLSAKELAALTGDTAMDERKLYYSIGVGDAVWSQPGQTLGLVQESDREYVAKVFNAELSLASTAGVDPTGEDSQSRRKR